MVRGQVAALCAVLLAAPCACEPKVSHPTFITASVAAQSREESPADMVAQAVLEAARLPKKSEKIVHSAAQEKIERHQQELKKQQQELQDQSEQQRQQRQRQEAAAQQAEKEKQKQQEEEEQAQQLQEQQEKLQERQRQLQQTSKQQLQEQQKKQQRDHASQHKKRWKKLHQAVAKSERVLHPAPHPESDATAVDAPVSNEMFNVSHPDLAVRSPHDNNEDGSTNSDYDSSKSKVQAAKVDIAEAEAKVKDENLKVETAVKVQDQHPAALKAYHEQLKDAHAGDINPANDDERSAKAHSEHGAVGASKASGDQISNFLRSSSRRVMAHSCPLVLVLAALLGLLA